MEKSVIDENLKFDIHSIPLFKKALNIHFWLNTKIHKYLHIHDIESSLILTQFV